MKRKKIVLSGVGTVNKGAELMLYAIIQEIERKYPDAIVYIPEKTNPQGLSYIRTNLELRYKPIVKWLHFCDRFHIRGLSKRLHINQMYFEDVYAIKGTDYFIDASGFIVSDQWNQSDYYIKRWNLILKRNKAVGAKIIFLSQAFGPLELKNTKELLSSINNYADIIMPRERVSLNYIKFSGLVNMNKVKLYSDFTSLVEGVFPKMYNHLKNGICIIPNMRMIDRRATTMEDYIHLLTSIVFIAKEKNKPVYLLNHEGTKDEGLAKQIHSLTNNYTEVVTGLNALEVKGMIASAYLVVSSRFHGVASALNSCVPCLATSWSHKYEELFKDYNQNECVLTLDNIGLATSKIKDYLDDDKNKMVRDSLHLVKPKIHNDTWKMWETVWNE